MDYCFPTEQFMILRVESQQQQRGRCMTPANDDEKDDDLVRWLASRKEVGQMIDPATALVTFEWGQILDPYRVRDLPPEAQCIGRNYFACALGSNDWVSFHDLPKRTVEIIWKRMAEGHVRDPFDDDDWLCL
jgi:hypothetical protein